MTSRKKKANGGYQVPEYENETKRTRNIMLETTRSLKHMYNMLGIKIPTVVSFSVWRILNAQNEFLFSHSTIAKTNTISVKGILFSPRFRFQGWALEWIHFTNICSSLTSCLKRRLIYTCSQSSTIQSNRYIPIQ